MTDSRQTDPHTDPQTDPQTDPRIDPVWHAAVDWVLRAHEHPLAPAERAELDAWLAQDPAHRAAYDKATRVWLITGLIPPTEEGGGNSAA